MGMGGEGGASLPTPPLASSMCVLLLPEECLDRELCAGVDEPHGLP